MVVQMEQAPGFLQRLHRLIELLSKRRSEELIKNGAVETFKAADDLRTSLAMVDHKAASVTLLYNSAIDKWRLLGQNVDQGGLYPCAKVGSMKV